MACNESYIELYSYQITSNEDFSQMRPTVKYPSPNYENPLQICEHTDYFSNTYCFVSFTNISRYTREDANVKYHSSAQAAARIINLYSRS